MRPHVTRPCAHQVCEPCVTGKRECPACGGTLKDARFNQELSTAIERNCARAYMVTDVRKTARMPPLEPLEPLTDAVKKKMATAAKPASASESPLRAYLDFEATDCTPLTCRITQIGCVLVAPDGTERTYNSLVKADRSVCEKAAEITGITNEKLKDAPPCKESLINFFAWLDRVREGRQVAFVAHNGVGFDYPLLMSEMWRWDMHPYTTLAKHGVVRLADSLPWCRVNVPPHKTILKESGDPSYKLGDLHESLIGHRFASAHDALADCRALRSICECDYVVRKGFTVDVSDAHSRFELKDFVSDFQVKRESADRITKQRVKDNANAKTKRALLNFFRPKDEDTAGQPPAKRARPAESAKPADPRPAVEVKAE